MRRETRTYAVEVTVDVDRLGAVPDANDVKNAVINGFGVAKWQGMVKVTAKPLEGGLISSGPAPERG